MSQHDFDIANQTASAARADINLGLKALASLSSGATAPATTYANMLWYDSGTNILKIRNEANSAWISVGYVDQAGAAYSLLDDTKVVNTSGTQTGLLGDQTTAVWQAGTGTTESLVSPAKVKAAIDISNPVKAWVNFNGTGTVSIRDNNNISSITDNGTGDYTLNFATPLASANYAVLITTAGSDTNRGGVVAGDASNSPLLKTSSAVRIEVGTVGTGTKTDLPEIYVTIIG